MKLTITIPTFSKLSIEPCNLQLFEYSTDRVHWFIIVLKFNIIIKLNIVPNQWSAQSGDLPISPARSQFSLFFIYRDRTTAVDRLTNSKATRIIRQAWITTPDNRISATGNQTCRDDTGGGLQPRHQAASCSETIVFGTWPTAGLVTPNRRSSIKWMLWVFFFLI